MFVHLPSVGYSEPEDYVVEDLVATRWKPLRGTTHALLVRKRLDDLQMNVVVWCPYKKHRSVRPFAQQTLFSGFIRRETDVRPYCPERVLWQFGHV